MKLFLLVLLVTLASSCLGDDTTAKPSSEPVDQSLNSLVGNIRDSRAVQTDCMNAFRAYSGIGFHGRSPDIPAIVDSLNALIGKLKEIEKICAPIPNYGSVCKLGYKKQLLDKTQNIVCVCKQIKDQRVQDAIKSEIPKLRGYFGNDSTTFTDCNVPTA